jgi:hypothetical protein
VLRVKNDVAQCFPEDYAVLELFHTKYQSAVEEHLQQIYGTDGSVTHELDVEDMLTLVEFMDYWNGEVVLFHPPQFSDSSC